MLLALTMVLALSTNVFANTAAVSVQVTVANSRSGVTDSWNVVADSARSVKEALDADPLHTPGWSEVRDYYNPSVTHYALSSYGGFASTKFNSAYEEDQERLAEAGYDYSEITWYDGAYQGYGLVGINGNEYTYIYAGYDWTYRSSSHSDIWDYMCCYYPQAGEEIYLVYDFTVSEWTTTSPLV